MPEPRTVVIRPMTEADLERVTAIEQASFSRPWLRDHFAHELSSPHSFPFVADCGDVLCGYVCLMSLLDEAQILDIAVDPDQRGAGIARALMGHAFTVAREQGAEVMALEVRASNSAAITLYERLGFSRTGTRRGYYDGNEDAVVMEKSLIESPSVAEGKLYSTGVIMQFTAMILSNAEVSPGYWRMRLTAPPEFAAASPGQFVMVRVNNAIDPLLRRPFGIFDVGIHTPAHTGATPQPYLEMLYRVVGKGTAMLAELHETDLLDILGPLGTGFDLGSGGGEKLIVGGGVGLAPLYLLAKELVKHYPVRLFAGGRTRDDILCITEFERLGVECYVATEDGSLGESGLVTEALTRRLDAITGKPDIFACGPHGMLNAVAAIAAARAIPCQVSLEGYMACGMGACLGCVTPGHSHTSETPDYRCVCTDGPVFDSLELKWEA